MEIRTQPLLQRQLYAELVSQQGKALSPDQAALATLAKVDPTKELGPAELRQISEYVNLANGAFFRGYDVAAGNAGSPRVRAVEVRDDGYPKPEDRAFVRRTLTQMDQPTFNNLLESLRKIDRGLTFRPQPGQSHAGVVNDFLLYARHSTAQYVLHLLDTSFQSLVPKDTPPFPRAGTKALAFPTPAPDSDDQRFRVLGKLLDQLEYHELVGFIWESTGDNYNNHAIAQGDAASDKRNLAFKFLINKKAAGALSKIYDALQSLVGNSRAAAPGEVQQHI